MSVSPLARVNASAGEASSASSASASAGTREVRWRWPDASEAPVSPGSRGTQGEPRKDKAASGEGEGAGAGAGAEEDDDAKFEKREEVPWGQLLLMLGLVGTGLWFGSITVRELLPTATSPQSIRARAFAALEGSPEVVQQFGTPARMYGSGYGSERGRRNFVESYTYKRFGRDFTRIKFVVENEGKKRATVFAEVDHSRPQEWSYLMMQMGSGRSGRVVVVYDNRKPEKPRQVRQREVLNRLLSLRDTRFYSRGVTHSLSMSQLKELGAIDDALKATLIVDCSLRENEERCERAGVLEPPAWTINGSTYPGKLSLERLEEIVGLQN